MLNTTNDIWICVYCDTELTNGSYCIPCHEYKGLMLKDEYDAFNLQYPRAKVGA
jgi:ribosomal protein L37AE/L43A